MTVVRPFVVTGFLITSSVACTTMEYAGAFLNPAFTKDNCATMLEQYASAGIK